MPEPQAFPQALELREPLPYACRRSSQLTYVKHSRSASTVNLTLVTFSGTYEWISTNQSVVGLIPRIVDEEVEGFDVGHGRSIGRLLHRHTHEDASHWNLHLLASQGVRNFLHLDDPVGFVSRRILIADLQTDAPCHILVQRPVALELHEQRHEELPARPVEVDDQRVLDLRHAEQRAIALRGADANAMAVERGVGAAQHEATASGVHAEEITVTPHPRPLVEIGFAIPAAVLVTPESHRHRGQRLR